MKVLLLTTPSPRLMNPATREEDLVPPKAWVPLGIAYLTSALRRQGVEVDFADLHSFTWEETAELIARSAPNVVGVSCFTFSRELSLRVAALARSVRPSAFIVMGGPHATFFPEQMFQSADIDAVVLGEGEEAIVELVEALDKNADLGAVTGVVYRRDGELLTTPPRNHDRPLDSLAYPAYDAFDLNEYKSTEIPPEYRDLVGTHMLSARGCPFHCAFCSVNNYFHGKCAMRGPDNVLGELDMLYHQLGVRHLYFSDDLFSLRHDRTVGICKGILDRGYDLAWMAETRVDCVNEEMLAWMRKAGCYRVYYGVESGSPTILKSINKGFTVEQVRKAFAMTHRAGIQPCCFLMVGNPGETPRTIQETIELIWEIQPATVPIMGVTTVLPGTQQYELAKEQGVLTDEYWLTAQPPPLYTGECDVDDLIALQMQLTRGVSPEMYEYLRSMGFDEGFFRLRRLGKRG